MIIRGKTDFFGRVTFQSLCCPGQDWLFCAGGNAAKAKAIVDPRMVALPMLANCRHGLLQRMLSFLFAAGVTRRQTVRVG